MNKEIITKRNICFAFLIVALSLIQVVLLLSLSKVPQIQGVKLSLLGIPIILFFVFLWIRNRKVMTRTLKINFDIILCICWSEIITLFLFLISMYFSVNLPSEKTITLIFFVCFFVLTMSTIIINMLVKVKEVDDSDAQKQNKYNLFNVYFINISKVFEIAMLINNKVITNGQIENAIEKSESLSEKIGANINIDYLNRIKSGVSYENSLTKTNSEKSRVLESFEVKTTKSNLLNDIISKCKPYADNSILSQGDLLLFKNVNFQLINQEESMQIMKFLLNGAFNGTVVSGDVGEMRMELNIASLINSILEDCSYELKCTVEVETGSFVFYVKIPMSIKNDFENSYNIYDLLISKMTLIGIYRGEDEEKKYRNFSDILNNNQSATQPNSSPPNNADQKTSGILLKKSTLSEEENDTKVSPRKYHYVDVIAIIQEINLD